MDNLKRPPRTRVMLPGLGSAVALIVLAGCQSYERVPLELADHRAALDARLIATEPISYFVERLSEAGNQVPERFDPNDGLSPAEGEVLALFYNPDLRLARLDAGVALATFDTAGLWDDPQFGFDGEEVLSGPFNYGLMLSLTIPISGRLGVEKDRAGAAYEAELRRIVDAEWSTRAAVRSAWASWSVASERLLLLREVIGQVERISAITDQLETAGELTRVEARLLRAELVETRADVAEAVLAEARARVELLGLMGLPPDAPVELLPAIPPASIGEISGAIERLIEANTTLAVRRAEYQIAEETLRLEVRKQYPDITIGTGYGSEDNDDRLLLGVSIPIPILNANRAGIAEAKARREVARAAAETTFERLTRELSMARAAYDASRTQRDAFERDLVPMLDEQASEVEQLIDLGEVNTLLLLETVTRGFEAKSRLLDLRLAETDAAIEITRLLGPDEPEMPAPVEPATDEDTTTANTPHTAARGDTPAEEASR
ncbi:MAG: TolC family protein [Phycisphaerales bacterium]|nr:TolC family protein [Phycisphaerales bacterium]